MTNKSNSFANIFTDSIIPTTTISNNVMMRNLGTTGINDHPYVIFAREIYIWLVPTMVTVLLLSIIGNGLIVLSAPWLGRHTNPYNRLCISLAAADAWAASLLIAGLVLNSYMPVVLRIYNGRNECIAAVLELFRISGMLSSNLHLLALAINQFIGIVFPLKYKLIVTTTRLRTLIVLLWLIPIVFVGAWFVAIPGDGFRHPRCHRCMKWLILCANYTRVEVPRGKTPLGNFTRKCTHGFYSRFPFRLSVFTAFVVPLFITYALYALILVTLFKAKAKYGAVPTTTAINTKPTMEIPSAFSSAEIRLSTRSVNYQQRLKSKLKLVWTTLLILSTFTLSWGVCVLYFLLVCIEGCLFIYMRSVSFHSGLLISSTVNFLVTLKLLLNPLIYALRMRHIRGSVRELLYFIGYPLRQFTIMQRHLPSKPVVFETQKLLDVAATRPAIQKHNSQLAPPLTAEYNHCFGRTLSLTNIELITANGRFYSLK